MSEGKGKVGEAKKSEGQQGGKKKKKREEEKGEGREENGRDEMSGSVLLSFRIFGSSF